MQEGATLRGWYQFILDTRDNPTVGRQAIQDFKRLLDEGQFAGTCTCGRHDERHDDGDPRTQQKGQS